MRVPIPAFTHVFQRLADWIREKRRSRSRHSPGAPAQAPPQATNERSAPIPQFDNAAGLAIVFDKGDDASVGDAVSYRVTTRKRHHLAIFDAAPDGRHTQVRANRKGRPRRPPLVHSSNGCRVEVCFPSRFPILSMATVSRHPA
jgi:hypothetical protein